MTRQEFEGMTGKKVSDMEYMHIEEIYMRCGDMDKQTFCRYYSGIEDNPIFDFYYNHCGELDQVVNSQRLTAEVAAFDLIKKSVRSGDDELLGCAIFLIGKKRYLLYKIDNDLPLSKEDKCLLKELI